MTCHVGISSGPVTVLAHTNYACGQLRVSACVFPALIRFQLHRGLHPFVECSSTLACVNLSLHGSLLFVWFNPMVHLFPLSTCPRLSSPAEVLLRLQLLFTVAQTQEVTLIYVKSHDFLKQLVESLVQNGSGVIRQGRAWSKSGGFCRILSNTFFSVFHFCNSISVCWIHLIGVCDYERPLLRKIVIDVRDDLNCDVCLSCPWWSNNL